MSSTENNPPLINAALEYARRGFHVFPVRPGGKDPLVRGGFKSATTDPETVRQWWTDHPQANIGVWPGGSGHVVLDIDVKENAGGENSLDILALMYGDLPDDAPVVETPSGGWHIWLTLPWDAELPGNRPAAQGVDVRSANGYTILPPSVTDAGAYQSRPGTPALERPGSAPVVPATWCAGAFASAGGRSAASNPDELDRDIPAVDLDDPADINRAETYASTVAPAVAGDGGDLHTYKVACTIRDFGLSQAENFRVMAEIFNPRCEPPWDDRPDGTGPEALATKVGSTYRNALSESPGTVSSNAVRSGFDVYADPNASDVDPNASDVELEDFGGWTRKTKRARFLSEAEIDEMEPPEWDIENVLPRRSLIALYGEPGSHKSFLALDWANHLARGINWAGREVDGPRHVLYVGAEGSQGLQKRLRAWRKHHGADMSDNITLSPDMPRIADEDAWTEWVQDVKELTADHPVDMVIFDTLAHLTVGLDENSNSDMMSAISRLTHLRDDLGASVMFVHHTSKGGKELRGAGAVRGACDAAFSMSKDGPGQSTLKITKQKDAEEWPGDISIAGHVITVGLDRKGREMTSLALSVEGYNNPPTAEDKTETDHKVRNRESQENFAQYAESAEAPAPSPEAKRPLAERARDVLSRTVGHEATLGALAREIVRDEVGVEPPSDLVACRREDIRKQSSLKTGDPALVPLVAVRDARKRAARFRLPMK